MSPDPSKSSHLMGRQQSCPNDANIKSDDMSPPLGLRTWSYVWCGDEAGANKDLNLEEAPSWSVKFSTTGLTQGRYQVCMCLLGDASACTALDFTLVGPRTLCSTVFELDHTRSLCSRTSSRDSRTFSPWGPGARGKAPGTQ